jgi:hypothetical protein
MADRRQFTTGTVARFSQPANPMLPMRSSACGFALKFQTR